ncbi:MAG: thioesterase family protein [Pseudomonadales bacterium]|nr:thioesterase family protein [Pseudomonadales bacterium]
MQQLDVSRVGPEEIDSLGHLNVRFYLARMDRASRKLLGALGLTEAALDRRHAVLRRVDTYSRFRREQFAGAELTVHGGILGCAADQVRCYFEIRNPARNELAAHFVTGTVLGDRTSRQPLELPASVRQVNEQYGVQIPDYAQPRSLSLDPPRTDVPFEALMAEIGEPAEFGMTGRREGVIEAEDCGPDGVLRDDVDLMFAMFRRQVTAADAKSFGPPVLYTDEGHRFGWAMLETRNVELGRPRAGDAIVWLGADVAIAEKSRQSRRWAFVKATGELLSIHDSVGVAMDLDARRAIAIPRSVRGAMEGHYLPRYA